MAELFHLHAQHRGQFAALGGIADLRCAVVGFEHRAALAQVLAQALLQQLGGRLAPACLGIGAQLLGVGIRQAVQHCVAAIGQAGGIHVGKPQGGQRSAAVAGGRLHGAGAKVVHHRARRGFGQGRAADQCDDTQ